MKYRDTNARKSLTSPVTRTGPAEAMIEHQLLAEPLLDAKEAARLLKVPRSTLYELVRSRDLPHVKVGRALRFTRADLGYWIADNSYGRTAPRRSVEEPNPSTASPREAGRSRRIRRGSGLGVGNV